jgi:hypothetical protein
MFVKPTGDHWHKTIWKLLTDPAIELVLTIALVLVATGFMIQSDPFQPGAGVPIFGRR